MGIRYSDGPIVYAPIRCDTSANMRGDIDAVLLACNWTHVRAVSNGFVYRCTSPDGLVMKLLVQDQGSSGFAGPWLIFQPMSDDEAFVGGAYTILWGNAAYATRGYEMVANQCQMFLALRGQSYGGVVVGDDSYSFACGIPALPVSESSTCQTGPNPILVFQLFWACGNVNPGLEDFRSGAACAAYDRCLNRTFFSAFVDGAEPSTLRIFPFCSADNVDSPTGVKPATLKYGTGAPLYLEAFLGWQWQIQGELWDAFQSTATVGTLGNVQSFTDIGQGGQTITINAVPWNDNPTGVNPHPVGGGTGTYFTQFW